MLRSQQRRVGCRKCGTHTLVAGDRKLFVAPLVAIEAAIWNDGSSNPVLTGGTRFPINAGRPDTPCSAVNNSEFLVVKRLVDGVLLLYGVCNDTVWGWQSPEET